MVNRYISQELRQTVVKTFRRRCAYCMTPAWLVGDSLTIDHIIPLSMGGETVLGHCQEINPPTFQEAGSFLEGATRLLGRILNLTLALENLCLACWACNTIKNDRITGIDPQTGQTFRLYHPHHMQWHQHFRWVERGVSINGVTSIGRTTVSTLQLNRLPLLETRRYWIDAGWHPPALDESLYS